MIHAVKYVQPRAAHCEYFSDFVAQATGFGPTVARLRLEERAVREPTYSRRSTRFARNRERP